MPTIIPIPGATTPDHFVESEQASNIMSSCKELEEIQEVLASCGVAGDRYYAAEMRSVRRLKVWEYHARMYS